MKNAEFISLLQKRIGNTSIGASTARGMPEGTIKAARLFLIQFDLKSIKANKESSFLSKLESTTNELKVCLPQEAQHWGSSRKFLNIFLRGCLYNRYICGHYDLYKLEPWLEVPLDSHVAKGLIREKKYPDILPKWKTVKGLTKDQSDDFQKFARKVADGENIKRVHLDLKYWRGTHMSNK